MNMQSFYQKIIKISCNKHVYLHQRIALQSNIQKRNFNVFFNWLTLIFNSVDKSRLKLVGPDLSCAEWLLRNGGTVRFKGQASFFDDYNALIQAEELPESKHYRVEEIFAKGTGLNHAGNLKKLILSDLAGVDNKAKCEAVLRKELRQCDIYYE